jgi:hypothetical protein
MSADPFAFNPMAELLDRSRALQRATAATTAEARAAFEHLLAVRAELRAELATLSWTDGPVPA